MVFVPHWQLHWGDVSPACCIGQVWPPSVSFFILFLVQQTSRQRRPFPQESVGGWRKDEVQSISLALVGDRNGIWPHKFCTSYTSWNVLSLHSFSFTAVPSPVWEGHGGMVLKRMYGEEESRGNWLTQVHLEESSFHSSVSRQRTVPVSVIYNFMSTGFCVRAVA